MPVSGNVGAAATVLVDASPALVVLLPAVVAADVVSGKVVTSTVLEAALVPAGLPLLLHAATSRPMAATAATPAMGREEAREEARGEDVREERMTSIVTPDACRVLARHLWRHGCATKRTVAFES
jgi:hypothetical protein